MGTSWKEGIKQKGISLGVIATSFFIAFCIQVVVHEMGHYLAGLAVGATGGQVTLHAFLNAYVRFSFTPSGMAQPFIGAMGIVTDVVLATLVGALVWRRKETGWLPLLMWGSIAYIGEGVGMLSSLGMYPEYREDITQLIPLGVPAEAIAAVSIVMVVIGLLWMALVLPAAGLGPQAAFLQRLPAYFCCLPLYFLVAIGYILLLHPDERNILQVRFSQLAVSVVLALILSVFHKPIHRLAGRIVRPKTLVQPTGKALLVMLVMSGLLFSLLSFRA